MSSFIPLLFLNALLAYCWLGVSSTGSFYAWTCAYGMSSAAFQSLFPTTVASLTANLNTMGTRLGMAFSVMAFAGLTGPPLGGALNSIVGGKYYPSQIWAGTSTLLGCVLITMARYKRYGWGLKKC
jgi:MFS family permease